MLRRDLALPEGFNPRALAWAAATHTDPRYSGATARQFANLLLTQIRTGGYSYTLEPGRYGDSTGHNAGDEF